MENTLQRALECIKNYNQGILYQEFYGFDSNQEYDALVIAPGWKPTKLITSDKFKVTELTQHSYQSGFLVERDNVKIAWAQTAPGGNNVLDSMILLSELKFKKCIFVGAVGSLVPEHETGDICTPEVCISGVYVNQYLKEKLDDFSPYPKIYPDSKFTDAIVKHLSLSTDCSIKKLKTFCTDSVSLEYMHLDEIKKTGAELIEMETGTFYSVAKFLKAPCIALLVVSDNSATGIPLLGRDEESERRYNEARCTIIPELIYQTVGM